MEELKKTHSKKKSIDYAILKKNKRKRSRKKKIKIEIED